MNTMRFQLKINNIEKHYFQLKQSFGAAYIHIYLKPIPKYGINTVVLYDGPEGEDGPVSGQLD